MALNTLDFTTLLRNQVTAIQGSARSLIDFSIGSVLRAIVEANSGVVMWLQGMILQVLAMTRAATSNGADLDSFVGDFGVTRLAAAAATGQVTFSRFTATSQAIVPTGTKIQSADGSQQFTVTLDTSNPAYNAALGGYVIAPGSGSLNVPVLASTAGTGGNAAIGGINTLTQPIPGVDTVTNAAAFTNGVAAETDAALRTRFVSYIASLAKATKGAIGYAITAVKQGLTYTLTENQLYNGTAQMGYFYAIVDDGTGSPPGSLLATIANAIDAVRPFTSTFGVFAPSVVNANASMTIATAAGYTHSAVVAQVVAALTNYINSLPLGASLPWSKLIEVAYDTSPGITNVTSILLNGATADLSATVQQIIKASTITVS